MLTSKNSFTMVELEDVGMLGMSELKTVKSSEVDQQKGQSAEALIPKGRLHLTTRKRRTTRRCLKNTHVGLNRRYNQQSQNLWRGRPLTTMSVASIEGADKQTDQSAQPHLSRNFPKEEPPGGDSRRGIDTDRPPETDDGPDVEREGTTCSRMRKGPRLPRLSRWPQAVPIAPAVPPAAPSVNFVVNDPPPPDFTWEDIVKQNVVDLAGRLVRCGVLAPSAREANDEGPPPWKEGDSVGLHLCRQQGIQPLEACRPVPHQEDGRSGGGQRWTSGISNRKGRVEGSEVQDLEVLAMWFVEELAHARHVDPNEGSLCEASSSNHASLVFRFSWSKRQARNMCTLYLTNIDPPVDKNVHSFKMAADSVVRGSRPHSTRAKNTRKWKPSLPGKGSPLAKDPQERVCLGRTR